MSGVPYGRKVHSPTGQVAYAQRHDGDYRIVDGDGITLGWMRGLHRGWSTAVDYNGEFKGRYADMGHALDGLLHARSAIARATLQDGGGG